MFGADFFTPFLGAMAGVAGVNIMSFVFSRPERLEGQRDALLTLSIDVLDSICSKAEEYWNAEIAEGDVPCVTAIVISDCNSLSRHCSDLFFGSGGALTNTLEECTALRRAATGGDFGGYVETPNVAAITAVREAAETLRRTLRMRRSSLKRSLF